MSSHNFKDLTGQRFGRLTVIERAERKTKNAYWKCRCDCGGETTVSGTYLRAGMTKSCGCLRRIAYHKTHGATGTRPYRIWKAMKNRCFNKNTNDYKDYGGRGITVCDEWRDDFKAFYDWAMTHGYTDELSIDRINVNGNYEPTNCRWATAREQRLNQRQTKKDGE